MPQKNWFDLPPLSLHEMTTDVSTDSATDDHLDFTMTHRNYRELGTLATAFTATAITQW